MGMSSFRGIPPCKLVLIALLRPATPAAPKPLLTLRGGGERAGARFVWSASGSPAVWACVCACVCVCIHVFKCVCVCVFLCEFRCLRESVCVDNICR